MKVGQNMMYLKEANRVIKELGFRVEEAKKLQFDSTFSQCLAEEIELSIDDLETPKAIFEIFENGDVSFASVANEVSSSPNLISIPLDEFKTSIRIGEKHRDIDSKVDIAKECLELELMTKKRDLIDRLLYVKK